jgi:hypothetical protein
MIGIADLKTIARWTLTVSGLFNGSIEGRGSMDTLIKTYCKCLFLADFFLSPPSAFRSLPVVTTECAGQLNANGWSARMQFDWSVAMQMTG